MYQAMRETRPHRRSIAREEIAATLEKEAEKGRLDREAVRAVLETAGHRVERGRARGSGNGGYPGGLTDREVEVLRLVSRGLTNKEVAREAGDLGAHGRPPPGARLREDRRHHARGRGDVRDEERDRRAASRARAG